MYPVPASVAGLPKTHIQCAGYVRGWSCNPARSGSTATAAVPQRRLVACCVPCCWRQALRRVKEDDADLAARIAYMTMTEMQREEQQLEQSRLQLKTFLQGNEVRLIMWLQSCLRSGIIKMVGVICGVGRGAVRVWDTCVGISQRRQAGTKSHSQCSARSSQRLSFLN